ncbi:response regulator transcription factor [Clostridium lacusfryxellense]|uniref:response regulator transcription factor n=1 Tax=Clostridium lacusfryxellense TaxID=205328 RepID=UPI001C0C2324|nr:response regulator [Clostridium lacusfryxellense]MBU3110066.1 response regulator [Clostridium lacusfryxellense]
MYGMIVVDDKEDIVMGIEKLGKWREIGVEIIGTASNGLEALKLVKKLKPKIIITDIKMPVMDGLQLTQKAIEFDENVKIILLSGYGEFMYAQQAMRLGAKEYLLKPATIETITEAVLRAKEEILIGEMRFNENIELIQRVKENLHLVKDKYFAYLVTHAENDIEGMKERLSYLEVDLDVKNFRVMVVSIDDYENVYSLHSGENYDLVMFGIVNILEETIGMFCKNVVFETDKSTISIIMNDQYNNIFSIAEKCKESINQYLHLSISIGIGRHYERTQDIYVSYKEAMRSVENRFTIGKNSIISINDIDVSGDITFRYPHKILENLIKYIKIGAVERVEEIFDSFIEEIRNKNPNLPKLIKSYLSEFIFSISKELMVEEISIKEILGDELEYVNKLNKLETLSEVKDELKKIIIEITNYIFKLKKVNGKTNIDLINDYINENYMKDISLNNISKNIFISPSYISTLIKENYNENFVDRVTRLRVEEAKLLLLSGRDKVYEIAEKVGYKDRRYFSDIFKKCTGLTPKEYVEKYRKL